MRVMVLGKATEGTEHDAGVDPDALEAMSRFIEALVDAGVLVALGGLAPTSHGKRIARDDGSTTVIDGPFAETKELIAGFMILEVEAMEDAMAGMMRAPDCAQGRNEMEIRPLMGMAEFETIQTPQTRAIRDRIRLSSMARTARSNGESWLAAKPDWRAPLGTSRPATMRRPQGRPRERSAPEQGRDRRPCAAGSGRHIGGGSVRWPSCRADRTYSAFELGSQG